MRYQFQSNPGQLSYRPSLFTDAIKILISINFGIFVLQSISSSEMIFFSIFGVFFRLLAAVYKFIRGDETALRRFFEKRSERKGFTSLINAFSANFEGDHKKSLLEIKRSKKYLKYKSLPDILSLSSYEALGNISEQKKIFEGFLKNKNTMSMGLFGLIKIKLAEGDTSLALKLTKKLIALKPKNISFQKTFLELQLMEEDWNGAHKTFLDLQKLEPTDKVARNRYEGTHLYLIAKKLREEGKIEEAMQKASKLIAFGGHGDNQRSKG